MNITVHKCKMNGEIQISYPAVVVFESMNKVIINTTFLYKKNFNIAGLTLNNGDCCIEAFYYDKWYNIFEVYDGTSETLKGWYCNITKPFSFKEQNLYYYDLALDIVALPDATSKILDEDEFAALKLDENTQKQAWHAVQEVRELLQSEEVPLKKWFVN